MDTRSVFVNLKNCPKLEQFSVTVRPSDSVAEEIFKKLEEGNYLSPNDSLDLKKISKNFYGAEISKPYTFFEDLVEIGADIVKSIDDLAIPRDLKMPEDKKVYKIYNNDRSMKIEDEIVNRTDRLQPICNFLKKIGETNLSRKLKRENAPKMAVSYSGGGFLSLIFSLGVTEGLKEMGLWDAVSYTTGVSGGSWFQSCLLSYGSIEEVEKNMRNKLQKKIRNVIIQKIERHVTEPLKMFQSFLGEDLKQEGRHLSSYVKTVENKKMPFPIMALAIRGKEYELLEITPLSFNFTTNKEVCGNIDSFGREFENGKTVKPGPIMTLEEQMAIAGSCYNVNYSEIIGKGGEKSIFDNWALFTAFKLPNPARGMNKLKDDKLAQIDELEIIDFGVKSHVSLDPVLERGCSIIFLTISCYLNDFRTFLQNKESFKHPLPESLFEYKYDKNKDRSPILFFWDKNNRTGNKKSSLVIVFQLTYFKDSFEAATKFTKLSYNEEEFNDILKVGNKAVLENKESIQKVIAEYIKSTLY